MSEEEKKAIQLLKSYAGMTHKLTDNQGRPKLDQAIERALNLIEKQNNRLEQLEKENEELKCKYAKNGRVLFSIEAINERYIPKSIIRTKIEELEKYIYQGVNAPQDFLQYRVKAKIQILNELLGEEK